MVKRRLRHGCARVYTEGVAALTKQGELLDRRLDSTGQQAQSAAQVLNEMTQAAESLNNRLGSLAESIPREIRDRRWRRWLRNLTLATAAIVMFTLGALAQRETFIFTLGSTRHEWNAFVIERYAPMLAACASKAWTDRTPIRCVMSVDPSVPVAVPLDPTIELKDVSPEGLYDPEAER